MLYKPLMEFKKELASFSRKEVLFIVCAMLCGFCICADYSLVRPISNSVFLTAYGSGAYPYAWLALGPFSLGVISLYNRALPRLSCVKLLGGIITVIVAGNLLSIFFLKRGGGLPFLFYIWKDVYVLLLFQQLWAMIHATVTMQRARVLYGLMFALGALGGIFGSLIPGLFALSMGSETLLIFSVPLMGALLIFYTFAMRFSGLDPYLPPTKRGGIGEGLKQIASSRILLFILLIVVFMQMASALLDYQFNTALQGAIETKDLRTEYVGRVMSLVNTFSFVIQLGGGFLLLSILGLKRTHFLIPMVFLTNGILTLIFPVFGMMTLSFVTIKAFDFSLFAIVKEMLYIPMKTEEKFHAKSVIDVFAYRAAKGLSAMVVLLSPFVTQILFVILMLWIGATRYFLWKEEKFSYYS